MTSTTCSCPGLWNFKSFWGFGSCGFPFLGVTRFLLTVSDRPCACVSLHEGASAHTTHLQYQRRTNFSILARLCTAITIVCIEISADHREERQRISILGASITNMSGFLGLPYLRRPASGSAHPKQCCKQSSCTSSCGSKTGKAQVAHSRDTP